MAGFTSGKVSHDPLPWLWEDGARSSGTAWEHAWTPSAYTPRPEFDNHNPILVAFREYMDNFGEDDGTEAFIRAEECASGALDAFYAPEHIDHAHRVLSKLAALS